MRLIRFPVVAVLALLAACDLNTAPNVPDPIDPANDSYAPSLGVSISTMTKTSSGLYFKDKVVGTGAAAQSGDSLRVHFTLWLTNGTKVQSSKDGAARPFEFVTGVTPVPRVIPGFEQGVIGMQPGGVRQLVVPPHLGWGAAGNPPVQPNANVVFEIEYIDRVSAAQ